MNNMERLENKEFFKGNPSNADGDYCKYCNKFNSNFSYCVLLDQKVKQNDTCSQFKED